MKTINFHLKHLDFRAIWFAFPWLILTLLFPFTTNAAPNSPLRHLELQEVLTGIQNKLEFNNCELSGETLEKALAFFTNDCDTNISLEINNSVITGTTGVFKPRLTVDANLRITSSLFESFDFSSYRFGNNVDLSGSTFSTAIPQDF